LSGFVSNMGLDAKIDAICPCGKKFHYPGSRYCVQCGKRLNIPKYTPPRETSFHIADMVEGPGNSNERIMGAELASSPFFVSSSGFCWHFGRDTTQLFPEIEKGPLLGIVSWDEFSPWGLLTWSKLVVLYNGFSGKSYVVWECNRNNDEECFRLPGVAVVGKPGCTGPFIRILLVLRKGGEIHFIPYDLILKKRQEGVCEWYIEPKPGLKPLPYDQALIVTAPYAFGSDTELSQLVVFRNERGGLSAPVLEFNPRAETNDKQIRVVSSLHLPFQNIKMLSSGSFCQCNLGKSVFFWGCKTSPYGDRIELLELRESYGDLPTRYNLWYWSQDYGLAQPGPMTPLINSMGEVCMAFLDDNDCLSGIRQRGESLRHQGAFNPAKIDRLFQFASSENSLWGVERNRNALLRYDIKYNNIIEYRIENAEGDQSAALGDICSPPVLAMGKVFYLRKVSISHDNKRRLRLEYVQ
jgi:hypothetical protein